MNGLPAIPKVGSKISAATVATLERKIADSLATIDDIAALEDVRAKAAALETYVRDKTLKLPMMGAQRRTEARIGQLLGVAERRGPGRGKKESLMNDSLSANERLDFRLFAQLLEKHGGDLTDADWRQSRRQFAAFAKKRLGVPIVLPDMPDGRFGVIVIDPPWPMQKIERDVAPKQVDMPYDVLPLEDIASMSLPAGKDCHLWCWATHRFLPDAFDIVAGWGFKYVCTFVWHKPGGFQPFGLPQYNCEFALYCRKGSPAFSSTKGLKTCFTASRGAHSEKPEEFYEMVRNATEGVRVDMFNRREIEGFEAWGDEA